MKTISPILVLWGREEKVISINKDKYLVSV